MEPPTNPPDRPMDNPTDEDVLTISTSREGTHLVASLSGELDLSGINVLVTQL